MAEVFAGIAVVGCLLGVMAALGAIAVRARRRGATASAVAGAMAA